MADNGVILFVKYPNPGRVKNRLSADIGQHLAAGVYRAFVKDIIQTLLLIKTPFFIYFYPDFELHKFKSWLGADFTYHCQKGTDLGAKMKNAFSEQFKNGQKKLILIGSDIPSITPHILRKAFESLDTSGCVLGPAHDGGYYLIGFRREGFFPDVFNKIAWSTGDVFNQTENKLNKKECIYTKLPCLRDIDRFDDLCYYYQQCDINSRRKNRTIEFVEKKLQRYF